MNKSLWQLLRPHAIALAIFFTISCIYCLPALKGMVLNQYDQLNWQGTVQQSLEFKEKHGHLPLWTNSLFSGMPAYQIALASKHNITLAYLHHLFILGLPEPAGLFFLNCLGFYLLCMALGARSIVGILGSLAYAFASYNAVIMAVGHSTKFASMGYMPAVLAGLILLTQGRYVAGFLVTLIFTTCMAYQGHIQVIYYTFLIAGCIMIAFAVKSIWKKEFKTLLASGLLGATAFAIGLASYAVVLLPTQDYAKESMRGGRSELTLGKTKEQTSSTGLDRDYAFTYSYGVLETLAFITPRIYGGSDPAVINNQYRSELGDHSKTAGTLAALTGMPDEQAVEITSSSQFSPYWGPQSSTSGAMYMGAIICVLFIAGISIYRGWHLGWIIGATLLGMALAWGKNFPAFNYFLFDHLPFYNKFRAPSMAMIIPQMTIPALAVLAIEQLLSDKIDKTQLWKKLKPAAFLTGGLLLVLGILYFTMDYTGSRDEQIKNGLTQSMLQQVSQGKAPTPEMQQRANDFGRSMINALHTDRQSLFGGDLLRAILFIALAIGLLFLYAKQKLKTIPFVIALTALVFIDLITVDVRYLSFGNYMPHEEPAEFNATRADLQIKQDTGYFRVYNMAGGSLLTDSRTSYFHNSVGGYHAARLALYEDIVNYQLAKGNIKVYNMLNTKYFIVSNPADQQPMAQLNPEALGPCWLVQSIKYVNNADEEMNALDTFNPKNTVIIDKREQAKVTFTPQYDSSATIQLVQNLNDNITYRSSAASPQFAVFSEVYYPRGWRAFIDGKETPIVKVNYALRGLPVPAGQHAIEFRFEPQSLIMGDRISLIAGIISILAVLAGAAWMWKNRSVSVQKTA